MENPSFLLMVCLYLTNSEHYLTKSMIEVMLINFVT